MSVACKARFIGRYKTKKIRLCLWQSSYLSRQQAITIALGKDSSALIAGMLDSRRRHSLTYPPDAAAVNCKHGF